MKRIILATVAGAFAFNVMNAWSQTIQPTPNPAVLMPADLLASHLRTLSRSPRDLNALLGAGQAALDVGDPNAALGFFSRAQGVDPRNGVAKAGLGSSLVQLERPDDALRLFAEAQALGVSESIFLRDRGLAYDLRGDNRNAQRDYVTALQLAPNDAEVIRRYALSLGISGDQAKALTALDPLLRRQDQGAWRARAFVLAMTGDVSGANVVARQVMPAGLASTMAPFLARLAKLNPAERAMAVNFGTMPADGQALASVRMGDPYQSTRPEQVASVDRGLVPTGTPLGPKAPAKTQNQSSVLASAPTTVPAHTSAPLVMPSTKIEAVPPAAVPSPQRVSQRIGPVDPSRVPPEFRPDATVTATRVDANELPAPTSARAAVVQPAPSAPVTMAAKPATIQGPPADPPIETQARPAFETAPLVPAAPVQSVVASDAVDRAPAPVVHMSEPSVQAITSQESAAIEAAEAASAAVNAVQATADLGSIVATLERENESAALKVPTLADMRAEQRAQARKAKEAADAAAAKLEAERIAREAKEAKVRRDAEIAKARAHPARLWVQVATGSNAAGVTRTWQKIRDGNAGLKPYQGYVIAFRGGSSRIVAGPLKSSADARALVASLAKNGLQAMTYSSEAGEEVVKIGAK